MAGNNSYWQEIIAAGSQWVQHSYYSVQAAPLHSLILSAISVWASVPRQTRLQISDLTGQACERCGPAQCSRMPLPPPVRSACICVTGRCWLAIQIRVQQLHLLYRVWSTVIRSNSVIDGTTEYTVQWRCVIIFPAANIHRQV